ncbi:ribosomal-processing cysteine protease Prp [Aerococcaceae bacterium DSM 111176]|nr:ribosomal-processing cysteine protease Prp [Aerococcaceae bacterium DSM 111176]
MIQINIKKDNGQNIQELELSGHAGFADHGYDIVCAAVSSQVISIENSLQQLLSVPVLTEVDDVEGGYLKLTLPEISNDETSSDAQLLLRHLEFALSVLMENYPEFINITIK